MSRAATKGRQREDLYRARQAAEVEREVEGSYDGGADAELRSLEAAWAFNCPPDFVGVPLLTLAGGGIGNSRHLAITRTHTQAPCVYAAFIGRPGTAGCRKVRGAKPRAGRVVGGQGGDNGRS